MKKTIALRSAVCVSALLTSTAAFADVTAEEVWADWQKSMALYGSDGLTVGETVTDGNTLTVRALTMSFSDEFSTISSDLGPLVFTENGDGSVSVTTPDSYTMVVDLEDDVSLDLVISQQDAVITVTGEPGAMNYDFSADSYTIEVAEIRGDTDGVEGDIFAKINGVSGSYTSPEADTGEMTYTMGVDSVDLLVDVKEPDGEGFALVSGKLQELSATGTMAVPEGVDFDDPDTLFANGFAVESNMSYQSGEFLIDFKDEFDAGTITTRMGEGGFAVAMNAETLSYEVSADGVDISAQVPDLPFPVNFSWNVAETGFAMPVAATEEAAPFGFNFALTDVSISEDIWAMADPAGALPHDPISIELALSGMAKLFFDLFDPEQAEAMAFADVPGELYALTLEKLRLSAVGGEVTGNGDFTFDNTDLETFDGLPRPAGELNVVIKGANALIDNAVNMGLLPQEQAGMGRLFMGMFTTPTGDDELTSTIEINDQGHIMANGQRIQ